MIRWAGLDTWGINHLHRILYMHEVPCWDASFFNSPQPARFWRQSAASARSASGTSDDANTVADLRYCSQNGGNSRDPYYNLNHTIVVGTRITAPKGHIQHEDPTNHAFWNSPLSWALEPECRILMFTRSLGPLHLSPTEETLPEPRASQDPGCCCKSMSDSIMASWPRQASEGPGRLWSHAMRRCISANIYMYQHIHVYAYTCVYIYI